MKAIFPIAAVAAVLALNAFADPEKRNTVIRSQPAAKTAAASADAKATPAATHASADQVTTAEPKSSQRRRSSGPPRR